MASEMMYLCVAPCGCARVLMTEECAHSKDGRKSISDALKRGYSIERVPDERLREPGFKTYCQICDPARVARKQQMTLEVK